jgi:hypothetical protein
MEVILTNRNECRRQLSYAEFILWLLRECAQDGVKMAPEGQNELATTDEEQVRRWLEAGVPLVVRGIRLKERPRDRVAAP